MATPTTTQTVDVEMIAQGADVTRAMDLVNAKIEKALATVNKISTSADSAAKNFGAKLDRSVKDLQRAMSQMATLEKSMYAGAGDVRQLNQAQQFGKQTEAAARFAGTVKNAGTAVEAVSARINDLTKRMARLGQQDFLPKQKMLRAQEDLRAIERELRSVDRTMDRLNTRGRASGGDFAAQQRQVADAQAALFRALQDGRRSNFTNELNRLRDATTRYGADIRAVDADLRRQGQAYDQLIVKARQYSNETRYQQEGRLRREAGRLAIPADVSTAGATEKLAQATLRASIARERLNRALAGNAGQVELAKAVGTYERYNGRLVEAVALHNKLQRELRETEAAQARVSTGQSRGMPRGPVSTILSPEYGMAAIARTSVYGAGAAAVYGVFNTMRDGARYVVEFQDSLAQLQSIASATDTQMVHLRETILDVGTRSKFAASEITGAATALAQAGYSTSELGVALEAVTNLAVASGSSVSEAADLVSAATGAFGMSADEAANISDAMVTALNMTRLTVPAAAQSLSYLGSTAHDLGISLNDTLAATAAIAQAGVRSSTGATGLRTLLTGLMDPSEKLKKQLASLGIELSEIDVRTQGLLPVIERLKSSGFGASEAYHSLEIRGAAAFVALSNHLDTAYEVGNAMTAQGTAADAAAKAMNSWSSQLQRTKNILGEGLYPDRAIAGMTLLLRSVNDVTDAYKELKEEAKGSVGGYLADVLGEFNKLGTGGHIGMVMSLAESFDILGTSLKDVETKIASSNEALNANDVKIGAVDDAIKGLLTRQNSLKDGSSALGSEVQQLGQRFEGLSAKLLGNAQSFQVALAALREYRAELVSANLLEISIQKGNVAQAYEKNNAARIKGYGALRKLGIPEITSAVDAEALAAKSGNLTAQRAATKAVSDAVQRNLSGRQLAQGMAAVGAGYDRIGNIDQTLRLRSADQAGRFRLTDTGERLGNDSAEVGAALSRLPSSGKERQAELARLNKQTSDDIQKLEYALSPAMSYLWNDGARKALESELSSRKAQAAQISALGAPQDEKSSSSSKANRAGAREARRQFAAQKAVSDAALKTSAMDLDEALKDNSEPFSFADLRDGAEEIEKALGNWVLKRQALMAAEVNSKRLTGEDAAVYKREIEAQIEHKRDETRKEIIGHATAMLKNGLEASAKAFEAAMDPFELGLSMASARIDRLDRTDMLGKVPDYVKQNMEFKKTQMAEQRDAASVVARDAEIDRNRALIADTKAAIAELLNKWGLTKSPENTTDEMIVTASSGALREYSGKTLKEVRDALEQAEEKTRDLVNANEALRESLYGVAEVPATLSDALGQAAVAYSRTNSLNRSFSENLKHDLLPTIGDIHGAFNTFFSDMLTKPQEVLNNLRNFALSVIRILQDMAAKALANQIFGSLLKIGASLLGGTTPAPAGGGDSFFNQILGNIGGNFSGGLIGRKEGGLVTEGVPNRDSVATKLARGEFVTRKSAVDSVGVDFMRDLNKRGARALEGLGGNVIPLKPTNVETNVYVIAPEERPQLGPNDVVAVISNELLRDGSLKKLVRHTSQGG